MLQTLRDIVTPSELNDPRAVARARKLAEALMEQASNTSPVQHWTQALARGVDGLVSGIEERRAAAAENKGREGASSRLAEAMAGFGLPAFGGGSQAAPPAPVNAPLEPSADQGEGGFVNASMKQAQPRMGGAATATGQKSEPFKGGPGAFIQAMLPHAMRVSEQTGVDPRIVVAQAALESGFGRKAPGNNFFGIKSHGKGGGQTFGTTEYINGQKVSMRDNFRAYNDMGESADDYARFLRENKRYRPMLQAQGLDEQIAALGRSGYATDPNYENKIRSIAGRIPIDGFQGAGDSAPVINAQAAPQQGQNPRVQKLIEAMSDPWLDEGQRSVLGGALQREMQQSDPEYQLGLEAKRLQLDQLRNPTRYEQMMDANGNLWQVDPRTNERKLLQEAPDQPKPPNPMSVNPGDVVIDPSTGKEIYKAPPKVDEKARVLAPEEIKQLGLPPGAYQQKSDGTISQIGSGGMSLETNSDGTVKFVQGAGKLTESEGKDTNWYSRLADVAPRMDEQDVDLNDLGSEIGSQVPVFGNYLKSSKYRRAQQTAREFIAPILRKDTGAAVTPSEMEVYGGIFIPQAGDDEQTIAQKRLARASALEALKKGLAPEAIRRLGADILSKGQAAQGDAAPAAEKPKQRLKYNPATGDFE